jgi:hypothetical protein
VLLFLLSSSFVDIKLQKRNHHRNKRLLRSKFKIGTVTAASCRMCGIYLHFWQGKGKVIPQLN